MENFPKNDQGAQDTQRPNYEYHINVAPKTEVAEIANELIDELNALKANTSNPNISPEERIKAKKILKSIEADYKELIEILHEVDCRERGKKAVMAIESGLGDYDYEEAS